MKHLLILIAILTLTLPLQAQWGRTAEEHPTIYNARFSQIISDKHGGVWLVACPGLHHLDREGYLSWDEWRPAYVGEYPSVSKQVILADNEDVFVVERVVPDDTTYTYRKYVQRFNSEGERLWGDEGIRIDERETHQRLIGAVSDGENGIYVVYGEWREEDDAFHPFIIRLSPAGENLWDGRIDIGWERIIEPTRNWWPTVVKCETGGVIILNCTGYHYNIVRMDDSGDVIWQLDSLTQNPDWRYQLTYSARNDGEDGIIIANSFLESEQRIVGLCVTRINCDGEIMWNQIIHERDADLAWQWDLEPCINKPDSGHYFISWDEYEPVDSGIMCIDLNGELCWDDPVIIGDSLSEGNIRGVDAPESVNYVWSGRIIENDTRRSAIMSQRVSLNGEKEWGNGGIIVMYGSSNNYLNACTDSNGGIITARGDVHAGLGMINRNGQLGIVLPPEWVRNNDNINNSANYPSISIYPQPANGYINIEYDRFTADRLIQTQIIDITGRIIRREQRLSKNISLQDIPSGEYILILKSQENCLKRNFVVQK